MSNVNYIRAYLDSMEACPAELRAMRDMLDEMIEASSDHQAHQASGQVVKGLSYRQEYIKCGKPTCTKCNDGAPGHGPYWYSYQWINGKTVKKYIGKKKPM